MTVKTVAKPTTKRAPDSALTTPQKYIRARDMRRVRWWMWGTVWHRDDAGSLSMSLCDAYANLMRAKSNDYIERKMDEVKRHFGDPPRDRRCRLCEGRRTALTDGSRS